MTPKKIDELALGATYLVVPAPGLVVRKAPRVSLAADGEVMTLTLERFRLAQHGDVLVYDVPAEPAADAPAAPEGAPEETPTAELESSAPKSNTRRARGDS